jgi:hypothetical protein
MARYERFLLIAAAMCVGPGIVNEMRSDAFTGKIVFRVRKMTARTAVVNEER